jgi:hypothetical protein
MPPESVNAATGTIEIPSHGFTAADIITFRVTDGGHLPTAISAATPYYPIPVSADLFQVALTPGGTPIASFYQAGAGWSVAVDPVRRIQAHIDDAAAVIDEHLTAHEPPIQPDPVTGKLPQILIGMNARIAARRAVTSLAFENDAFRVATDRLFATEAEDLKILEDWKKGKPITPRPTDETPATADNGAFAGSGRDSIPWSTGSL